MTAKQKAARENFKKVVAEAKKLRAKNKSLTQAQAVKQAWAIYYNKGKKMGSAKTDIYTLAQGKCEDVLLARKLWAKMTTAQKKAYREEIGSDDYKGLLYLLSDKNVMVQSDKKVGALPIDFKGNFLGYRFKVINQYQIDGKVTAQLVEMDPPGKLIAELSGNPKENARAASFLIASALSIGDIVLDKKDEQRVRKSIEKFVTGTSVFE